MKDRCLRKSRVCEDKRCFVILLGYPAPKTAHSAVKINTTLSRSRLLAYLFVRAIIAPSLHNAQLPFVRFVVEYEHNEAASVSLRLSEFDLSAIVFLPRDSVLHYNLLRSELRSCNPFRNASVPNKGEIDQFRKFGQKLVVMAMSFEESQNK